MLMMIKTFKGVWFIISQFYAKKVPFTNLASFSENGKIPYNDKELLKINNYLSFCILIIKLPTIKKVPQDMGQKLKSCRKHGFYNKFVK